MDLVDMVMFSINAAYDVNQGEYACGQINERDMMYRHCQIKGVGIAVMKPFSAGQLLDDKTSPFHQAMTPYQCIAYALDRPGVLTVLPGVRNRKDLKDILGFTNADPKDKDYSMISSLNMTTDNDRCVYCNHCASCPIGIDIGLTNKYYDLSMAWDDMAKDHYLHLNHHASECIHCHHCDDRCPFHVKQEKRMQTIASYFGI